MQFDATTRLQVIRDEADRRARDYQRSQRLRPDDELPRRRLGPTLAALGGRLRRRRTPQRALA